MPNLRPMITEFVDSLTQIIETEALDRARLAVSAAFGGDVRTPGRTAFGAKILVSGKPRKKPPRQLCPVPGCKETAAPIFGMVCSKHKDMPKSAIKKFREARRAAAKKG